MQTASWPVPIGGRGAPVRVISSRSLNAYAARWSSVFNGCFAGCVRCGGQRINNSKQQHSGGYRVLVTSIIRDEAAMTDVLSVQRAPYPPPSGLRVGHALAEGNNNRHAGVRPTVSCCTAGSPRWSSCICLSACLSIAARSP